jgi:hypothetical protein
MSRWQNTPGRRHQSNGKEEIADARCAAKLFGQICIVKTDGGYPPWLLCTIHKAQDHVCLSFVDSPR